MLRSKQLSLALSDSLCHCTSAKLAGISNILLSVDEGGRLIGAATPSPDAAKIAAVVSNTFHEYVAAMVCKGIESPLQSLLHETAKCTVLCQDFTPILGDLLGAADDFPSVSVGQGSPSQRTGARISSVYLIIVGEKGCDPEHLEMAAVGVSKAFQQAKDRIEGH